MTVSTTSNKIIYTGNGSQTNFPFTFAVPVGGSTDIQVYFTDASGNITLLSSAVYTLTINPAVSPNPTAIGGTVIYNPSSVPIPLGTSLTILRSLPQTQPDSFVNQGALYPSVIETSFDNEVMLVQQLSEQIGRQLTVAVSDPTPSALPAAAARALMVLGFDSSGNPIAVSTAPAGVISSAMAPFVGASTLAAAKALLGYGSMANENIGASGRGLFDDGSGNARINWIESSVSTNQAVGLTNHMTHYVSSGTLTHTLAKLSTLFNGFEVMVWCISGSVALTPNASDTIQGQSSGTAINLTAGQVARVVGDGVGTWLVAIAKIFGVGSTSTMQVLTSGTTYNTPKGCTRIKARYCGGGGGGGGNSTNGGNGGNTSFNSVVANGGTGAVADTAGAGGTGGSGSANLRIPGGHGGLGGQAAGQVGAGGGVNPFGGGVGYGAVAVPANTGAGGYGMAGAANTHEYGGGGAGEYVELLINNPVATYTYAIGAAGTAGTGTASSCSAGSAGIIVVEEFYD